MHDVTESKKRGYIEITLIYIAPVSRHMNEPAALKKEKGKKLHIEETIHYRPGNNG